MWVFIYCNRVESLCLWVAIVYPALLIWSTLQTSLNWATANYRELGLEQAQQQSIRVAPQVAPGSFHECMRRSCVKWTFPFLVNSSNKLKIVTSCPWPTSGPRRVNLRIPAFSVNTSDWCHPTFHNHWSQYLSSPCQLLYLSPLC